MEKDACRSAREYAGARWRSSALKKELGGRTKRLTMVEAAHRIPMARFSNNEILRSWVNGNKNNHANPALAQIRGCFRFFCFGFLRRCIVAFERAACAGKGCGIEETCDRCKR